MKSVFTQMETDVANCFVDKKYFEIEKNELSLDNDRLLEHIICQDIMNTVMHGNDHYENVLPANNNSLVHDNSALDLLKHENDRLMELLISQDLVNTAVNSLATINDYKSMEQSFVDEYEENLKLQTELATKNYMIEKAVYNELSKQCSRLENLCISLEIKLQQNKESFQNNRPSHNQDAPKFKDLFIINEFQAQLEAKNVSIAKLKEHIATSKVYKLDLKPLFPLVKYNKDAHVNYLKHTQENADTLCEIIEHARELRPLDSNLDSACKFVTRIQELLVHVNQTCPSTKPVSNKLVVVTPINRTRKVRFAESNDTSTDKTQKQVQPQEKHTTNNSMSPSTGVSSSTEASGSKPRSNTKKDRISQTSCSNNKTNKVEAHPRIAKSSLNNTNCVSKTVCNENVKHSVLNANSELVCATCHECMFDAIHDICVSGYLNDLNARVKSKSVKSRFAKNKKREMWKPTGKVYTKVGYIWKPTGRTFTIVGNIFHLTRIISTKVVPPRKSTSTALVKKTQPSSNKFGKLKNIKHLGSSSQSKTEGSKISNHSEPMQKWGSKVSTAPSSSRVNF
ncbi:hypothetical protein Tco_1433154, partial [Tanacetum coccineum]